jgi:hypothetical protein
MVWQVERDARLCGRSHWRMLTVQLQAPSQAQDNIATHNSSGFAVEPGFRSISCSSASGAW